MARSPLTRVASWTVAGWTMLGGSVAHAQISPLGDPVSTWVPNGGVSSLAVDGDILYVGGEFDQVGPPTGTFATVDVATGAAFTTGANLRQRVTAIVSDSAGGWFVATVEVRSFSDATINLDHVLPGGAVDPAWVRPAFDRGFVSVLALEGGRLFAGGVFTAVNGRPRRALAAFDPASGTVLPWTADLTWAGVSAPPSVSGIATSPGRLYATGAFSHVGATPRSNFAVLDAATGAVLPPSLPDLNGYLGPPAIAGNRVYMFGACRTSLYEICAYDLDLVPLPGWTFPLSNRTPAPIAASDSALFASYRSFEFPFTERTVKLDPATGVELAWAQVVTTGGLDALTAAGGRLYLAGRFTDVNGEIRSHLAAVNATTGVLDAWAPLVGGPVAAVSVHGGSVGLGGVFSSVGGIRKRNLVAIDLRTGAPATPNAPDLPFAANAFQKLGDVMVAAGGQNSPLAPARPDVMAFSTNNGALLPWSLTSSGTVFALAADDQRLFVGGDFRQISGVPRRNLAAVDLRTAAIAAWNGSVSERVLTLAVSNGALYTGGGFPGYAGGGGEPRNMVAALDRGNGSLLPFSPHPAMFYTAGFAFHQNRVLLVGGGVDALEWVDRTSGAPVPPSSDIRGAGIASVQVGDTVLVTGQSANGAGVVALVDAPSGRIQVWAPDGVPSAIAASATYVALAGQFSGELFDRPAGPLMVFRRPGPGAPQRVTASVVNDTVTLGWQAGPAPATASFVVEAGTSFGAADVGAFAVGPATSVAGTLPPGTYFTRVRGVGTAGAGAASSEVIVTVPAVRTPPNAPGPLSASVTGGSVTLRWGAASGNATTYVVEAGTASGLSNIGVFVSDDLDTSFATGAPPGTYFVRVRAANAFGASAPTNEVTIVVP